MIGKGGATINQIRDTCGVKIDIPPRESIQYSENVEIKITGQTQQSIEEARKMIMNLTERSYGQARNESFGSRDRSASVKRQYSDDRGEKKDQFYDNKRPFSPLRSAQNPESKPVGFKLCLSTVNMQ